MLAGNNSFEWNQATMRKAVQHYLDTVVLKESGRQIVLGVRETANRNDGAFTIAVSEKEEKK